MLQFGLPLLSADNALLLSRTGLYALEGTQSCGSTIGMEKLQVVPTGRWGGVAFESFIGGRRGGPGGRGV